MTKQIFWVEVTTAFVIGAGGAILAVTASGYKLNIDSVIVAVVLGLVTAAKDARSLLKLPPVETPSIKQDKQ